MIISLKEFARRREKRIPGFMSTYVYSEYWKSIIRLVLSKDNNLYTLSNSNCLILSLDKVTYNKFLDRLSFKHSDLKKWSCFSKNFHNFFLIYAPFFLKYKFKKYKKIYFCTDISLSNYNAIKILPANTIKVCLQHGYFPVSNSGDIDGLNADQYFVRSVSQKNILLKAGYTGKCSIHKFNNIVFNKTDPIKHIVLVGPGYQHSRKLEKIILEIAVCISRKSAKPLYFRPHSRCSKSLINEIKRLGISIDKTVLTNITSTKRLAFVGVKSTLLLDAQEIGHQSILIEHPLVSKYFPDGEIIDTIGYDKMYSFFSEI